MDDSYITLVASVTSDKRNTSSKFITRLPETLNLKKDKHLVGLTEIIFPRSMQNLGKGGSYTIKYNSHSPDRINVPRGHYESGTQLSHVLNTGKIKHMEDENVYDKDIGISFMFSEDTQLFKVVVNNPDVKQIVIDPDLAYFLGFNKNYIDQTTEAVNRIDFFNQQSLIYIYSDMVTTSIVGNTRASLLQCCPVTGTFGEMVRHSFFPVRYLPIMCETIDSIFIEILSEQGVPIDFNFGSVVLTLHIKTK